MATPNDPQQPPPTLTERVEVILEPPKWGGDAAAGIDLDRLPDPEGRVRALVTPDQLAALHEAGFGVEVVRRLPVAGLDADLVFTDEAAQEWLTSRLDGVRREHEAD